MVTCDVRAIDLSITDAERQSLPPYCKPGHPWFQVHLCNGLNFINRHYRDASKSQGSFNLDQAVGELSYVISHFGPNYPLCAEAYLKRADAYFQMRKFGQAVGDWNMAIQLNPQSVMAYMGLAEYYSKLKLNDRALEIITTGLRNNPESKLLKRKYEKLGGKLPYPEPIITPGASEQANVKQDTAPPHSEEAEKRSEPASDRNIPSTMPKEVIGSPTNPWCRFCADLPPAPQAPTSSSPEGTPKALQ